MIAILSCTDRTRISMVNKRGEIWNILNTFAKENKLIIIRDVEDTIWQDRQLGHAKLSNVDFTPLFLSELELRNIYCLFSCFYFLSLVFYLYLRALTLDISPLELSPPVSLLSGMSGTMTSLVTSIFCLESDHVTSTRKGSVAERRFVAAACGSACSSKSRSLACMAPIWIQFDKTISQHLYVTLENINQLYRLLFKGLYLYYQSPTQPLPRGT